ncbi:hypothetical protein Ctob_008733 [Chrysochromulina tobinii]|uniref:EF-hand domain-containing protein n=1 Tax=Chrysochromulina tobinii TaxID=1460289 RepID=A0A0M0K170_9EUKA|nr:hypothetical protein Ctob_008733 [Chrysochromulina tobinii]|eukprot:KOO32138.1 hypothetical protein Ctob_008733 [Chrysochromulina sp. CCMP291]
MDRQPAVGQRPSSSLDFSAHAVREFQPARRAQPSVCVVTVMTANLLGGWGGHAVEQTLNWALAHGYTYALFTERLVPETIPAVWSNPLAVHVMLERGEDACAVVFYLDGDAVVNNVSSSLEGTIERLLPLDGPSFVFPCHSPFAEADGATCHVGGQCRCGRAAAGCSARALERMAHRKVTGAKHVPWCLINSGAYLVRNTARARARVKWWAERDGCEVGTLGRGAPEQACAQRMKALWPAEVDVVSARLFNTPAWFDAERVGRSTDPIAEYEAMRLTASSPEELRCFGDPRQLVCHLWNALRRRPPQVSFQASPFEPPPPAEQLYVGAEANRYGELANPSSVGGDEMLRSDGRDPRTFTGRTVLNSGVILGQLPTLLAYLDWLLASAGPWCDQGRLNAFALAFPERVAAPPLGASRFLTFDRFDLGRLWAVAREVARARRRAQRSSDMHNRHTLNRLRTPSGMASFARSLRMRTYADAVRRHNGVVGEDGGGGGGSGSLPAREIATEIATQTDARDERMMAMLEQDEQSLEHLAEADLAYLEMVRTKAGMGPNPNPGAFAASEAEQALADSWQQLIKLRLKSQKLQLRQRAQPMSDVDMERVESELMCEMARIASRLQQQLHELTSAAAAASPSAAAVAEEHRVVFNGASEDATKSSSWGLAQSWSIEHLNQEKLLRNLATLEGIASIMLRHPEASLEQGRKVCRHVTDDVLTIFRTYDKDSSGSIDLDELSTALSDLKLSASSREIVEIMQYGVATQAVSKHQAELHRSYGMLEMALPASERFELRVAAPGATPGKVASVEQFDPAGQPCIFETKAAPSASKEDPNHMAMVSMLLAPLSQALTLRVEVALLVNNGGKHWAAGLATLDIIRYEVAPSTWAEHQLSISKVENPLMTSDDLG